MPALSTPDTIAGPLTAADLDRDTNPGNVYPHMHRVVVMPAGLDQQGRHQTRQFPDTVPTDHGELGWLDSCAPEGGKARSPAPAMESMLKHRRNVTTIKYAAALAVAVAVVGYVVQASA
jgi:hypothetical protein